MVIGAAAGGAFVGLMIGRNIETSRKAIAAAKDGWKELEARGFALSIETLPGLTNPATKERPMLVGKVDETAVEVHLKTDVVHIARTEITAQRAVPFEGVVGVHPSPGGALGYLRSWIGQDILIGDEAFDEGYLITGKPENAAASVLVPTVRELVASLGDRLAAFVIEGTTSRVVLVGAVADHELVGAGISLAAAGAAWLPT